MNFWLYSTEPELYRSATLLAEIICMRISLLHTSYRKNAFYLQLYEPLAHPVGTFAPKTKH